MREIRAVAPRRVFCVFEQRYRSRAVADAVLGGRFPIQGTTVDLGLEPDWLGARLPTDNEWRLEWSKFYYGLDLAAAGEETGNVLYARAWQQLVLSWIAQVAIDADPSDVAGRRIQNWVYAWSRFAERFDLEAEAPGFTDRITASLDEQVGHLERHLTRERNHRTLELYALFIAALALPHLDRDRRLLDFAISSLHRNLVDDVLADGVQRERSTHYHHVVLRSFLGMRENARRFNLDVPDGFDRRLARACEFALHCHRPDGAIPALSDSDSGSYLDLLALAGDLLDRPDFTYVASRGTNGVAPAARHASFAQGGYYIQRSGWGGAGRDIAAERYLIFDCGAIGDGGHGHYDALNVEIAADGGPLVVDPGRYTYCDDPPHWRRWFKGSAAHNIVTIDGLDQTPYRRGKPKGAVAEARLLQRVTGDGLDLLWGEVASPAYAVVHRRRILFVADEYWLIEDTLDAQDVHRYQLRFHLTPDAAGQTTIERGRECSVAVTPRVALIVAGDARPAIEAGWVAPEYGIKLAAPVVVFSVTRAGETTFLTLVAPLAAGPHDVPSLSARRDGHLSQVDIRHRRAHGVHDRVTWTVDGCETPAAGAAQPAIASWTRRSTAGALVQATSLLMTDRRGDAAVAAARSREALCRR